MTYGDYHSHTADDVSAAPAGHRHNASEADAAEYDHRHYPRDIGAAPEGHEHPLSHIAGAASESDLNIIERRQQQDEAQLTSALEAIRTLQTDVSRLAAELAAERAANEALRAGAVTLPLLVKALRYEAQIAQNYDYGQALFALATTIQREAR
jgi:hypothetical protein